VIGSPIFARVTLNLPNGQDIEISAVKQLALTRVYINQRGSTAGSICRPAITTLQIEGRAATRGREGAQAVDLGRRGAHPRPIR